MSLRSWRPVLGLAIILCASELILRAGSAWNLSRPDDPPWISFLGVKRLFPAKPPAPAGTRRVICVGGSTTAGYPFPRAGFPEWMQRELDRCGKAGAFEVSNHGLPGYGTLRVPFVLREALGEKPWAVVFYSGHNEVGERMVLQALPASSRGPASLFLRTAVATQLIRALSGPLASARGLAGPFGLPERIGEPHPRSTQADFEQRLRKMTRDAKTAGALPIICVTPTNLHFRPLTDTAALLSRAGEAARREDWVGRYRKAIFLRARGRPAAALDLLAKLPEQARVPGVLWLMGMCSEDLGKWAQAARLLRLANTVGPVATDAIRRAQRRIAREEGAVLVDLEEAFSAGAPAGLPDGKYFVDSHHLSLLGYRFAARRIIAALAARGLTAKTCPLAWNDRRPDRMLSELGLKPSYEAVPAGLLANEYALYGAGSNDPWFQEQAVALLAKGLRADAFSARARLRLDSPPVREVLSRASAMIREVEVRGN